MIKQLYKRVYARRQQFAVFGVNTLAWLLVVMQWRLSQSTALDGEKGKFILLKLSTAEKLCVQPRRSLFTKKITIKGMKSMKLNFH
ncbi:hypothetical protein [Desulfonatronospira sp. MSAO_Bac3]|uniref:hypothetical protein n=1 Tax=Desulfonatronospira sp. MSAO_Bac3 TaxID=2293857 RepID=UPI000FF711EB|nr:hypothetical protein [Desulfonatronospira sp. MSAO_Bac3]RQD78618.1 MAG: hypothetical protein D5S03_02145 [Desulfonatronospira sp. MSAO_Bac3]